MTNFHSDSLPPNETSSGETGSAEPQSHKAGIGRNAGARDMRFAAITAATYLLFLEIVARVPGGHIGMILATTLVSLLYTLVFTVYVARALRTLVSVVLVGMASFVLIAPSVIIPLLIRLHPEWSFWVRVGPYFLHYRAALHAVPGVDGLLMVSCAVSIGVLISRIVREFKMLVPIAVVLATVDMYVVFGGGLVTQAENGNDVAAKLMNSLTVKLPTIHPATGALPMQLELGFADYLFIGLFFACFVKFGAPSRQTFQVLCCTLAGVMLFVGLQSVEMPALVPIAAVVLGMNIRAFKFARDELFAMMYAGIIVAAIIVILAVRSRNAQYPVRPPNARRHSAATYFAIPPLIGRGGIDNREFNLPCLKHS